MNELKLEDKNPLAALKNNMWQAMNLLRGFVDGNEFHFVLFLLTLQRKGVLQNIVFNEKGDLRQELELAIHQLDADTAEDLNVILRLYDRTLRKVNTNVVYELISFLRSLDKEVLEQHFPEIFDELLYKLSKWQGRVGGESMLPIEISRFVCALAELPSRAKVYNPFAGVASFGVCLDEHHQYIGQEINHSIWAIGQMRLMAYNREFSSKLLLGDSIKEWNPIRIYKSDSPKDILLYGSVKEKYDLIIANPPYGMRIPLQISGKYGAIRSCEHFLIENGIEDLKPGGKLIAVISQAFLFHAGTERHIRQHLIENDLLETVISLPGGLLMNTGIPVSILVINKSKKKKGLVQFIDAKSFVDIAVTKEKVLKDYALNSFIKTGKESEFSKIVSNETISEYDFNLSIPRYFQKKYDGIPLHDLGTLIRGNRVPEGQKGKFIRVRDLKDDASAYQIDLDNIEDTEVPSHSQKIEVSCLLLASRWKTLKPTYFKYSGVPIYIRPDTLVFIVDESKCDIGYLINELYADYVNEQLESYRVGEVIPMIRREDLLSIKINLPSLEEQRAKIAGIKEAGVKMKLLEAERNALAHGLGNLVYENFASVKHSLGKPLLNIGSSLRNIEKAMGKLDKDWEIMKLSERMDVTLKDSFDSIYSNLELIHSLLKNNEREFEVANYKLEEIDFLKFIRAYIKKIKSVEKVNVNINLDINPDLKNTYGKQVLINSNKELLEIALNNIVENANMHAFLDESKKYKLEFRLSLSLEGIQGSKANNTTNRIQPFLKIEVANNGEPFPENYTLEKFIRKNSFAGKTGNTGIGGYDINEIVKYHNSGVSTLDIVTTDFTTEFVTTYEFTVPIINT